MTIDDLKGKLVAVLGFGQEGRAVTDYLLKHGITPVLFDARPWEEWPEEEKEYIRSLQVNFIFDSGYLKELKGFDVVFRSPGIKLSDLRADKSARYKTIYTSQTKWFFEHCPAKIIGVTGTKGKGTTSSLIYEILKKNFQFPILRQAQDRFSNSQTNPKSKIYLTGNIGKIQPLEFLDDLTPNDWVVYELSSFQLQDLDRSPHIGVVLMTTSEHLDYHRDNDEYIEAKSAIVKYQLPDDYAVINADFENSIKIGEQGKGQKYFFSRKKEIDCGCFIKNGEIVFVGDGLKPSQKDGRVRNPPLQDKFNAVKTSNLQLRGQHNLENVCAAVMAAKLAGAQEDAIISIVQNYKGLEHRLEFVAEKNSIKFYNDSFSTTPETAIAAINAFDEPEIVILGGSSKNSDFTELGKTVAEAGNVKAVILIGQEANRIKQEIDSRLRGKNSLRMLEGARSMADIFKQIKSVTEPGEVVILSPACASFDMFKNYKDRGEQFKTYVHKF